MSLASAQIASENVPALSVDLRKPPTLAEAIAYARVRMPDIPLETISTWHQTMSEHGWICRNGHTVRNWAARRMFRELDAPVHEHPLVWLRCLRRIRFALEVA